MKILALALALAASLQAAPVTYRIYNELGGTVQILVTEQKLLDAGGFRSLRAHQYTVTLHKGQNQLIRTGFDESEVNPPGKGGSDFEKALNQVNPHTESFQVVSPTKGDARAAKSMQPWNNRKPGKDGISEYWEFVVKENGVSTFTGSPHLRDWPASKRSDN